MPVEIARQPAAFGVEISLRGVLGFHTVGDVSGQVDFASHANQRVRIDWGQAQCSDSSAVALCVEWLRQATAAGVQLELVNLPENLVRLMRVNKVDSLFHCSETQSACLPAES